MNDNFEDLNKSLFEIDEMWKALRDKSKLIPVKRPVKRKDGKTFMQTFYIQPGETETEDKPKTEQVRESKTEQVRESKTEQRESIVNEIKKKLDDLFYYDLDQAHTQIDLISSSLERFDSRIEKIKISLQQDPDNKDLKRNLKKETKERQEVSTALSNHEKKKMNLERRQEHMLEVLMASNVDLVSFDRSQKINQQSVDTGKPMSKEEAKKTISDLREKIGTEQLVKLAVDNGVTWTRNEKHVGNDYMQLAMKLTKHFMNGKTLQTKQTQQQQIQQQQIQKQTSIQDDVKERQLDIFNKRLSEVEFSGISVTQEQYKNQLKSYFINGSEQARKLFLLFWDRDRFFGEGDTITSFISKTESQYYSPFARKMAIDFDSCLRYYGSSEPFFVFFHEYGHMVDHYLTEPDGIVADSSLSSSKNNKKKFEESIKREAKKILGENGENYLSVKKDLSYQRDGTAGVRDLLGGAEKNKYIFSGGHHTEYWEEAKDALVNEAFAHMFHAEFYEKDRKMIEKYFPESFKIYKEMVGEVVDRHYG